MSFFANRFVAVLFAAAIVFTSTGAGAKIGMEKESRDIEEKFYSGVEYDGYMHKSIYSQLDQRGDAANGLLSYAETYGLDTEYNALKEAISDLGTSTDINGYYYNDQSLETAFDSLSEALKKKTISERDKKAIDTYTSVFDNAAGVIEKSGYNEAIRSFYSDVINEFPASILATYLNIDTPDYFGTMW